MAGNFKTALKDLLRPAVYKSEEMPAGVGLDEPAAAAGRHDSVVQE